MLRVVDSGNGIDAATLIEKADAAMYQAKQNVNRSYESFKNAMSAEPENTSQQKMQSPQKV